MEDIEIGEYVRTEDGKIGIFVKYSSRKNNSFYKSPFNCFIKFKNRKSNLQCCRDYIVKHSKNIIDLIEINDIVKYKLKGINSVHISEVKGYIDARKKEKTLMVDGYKLEQVKILKVLTHEQFEEQSYEVL